MFWLSQSSGPQVARPSAPAGTLLASRVRGALWVVVGANLLFAVADLRLPPGVLGAVLGLKALQLVAVSLGLVVLSRLRSRRAVSAVAVAVGGVVLGSIVASSASTGDVDLAILLCVGLVLGAAAWIPWGVASQIVIAIVAVAAIGVGLELSRLGLAAAWGYVGLGVGSALLTSIVLAAARAGRERAGARIESERTGAEAALRRSEAELRGIFESLEDIFYRTDLDGRIEMVSPSVERYGYTVDELIGSDVRRLYHDPGDRPGNIAKLLEHGRLRDFELVLVAKDGSRLPVSANVRLLHDRHGRPIGLEGMLRDIRERKRAEEDLRLAFDQLDERVRARTADLEVANARLRQATELAREAEHRFRTVSELTSDYAYCFRLLPDLTAEVEWMTAASFERVTGYAMEEVDAMGGGLGLVHPDDLPIAQARLVALVSGRPDVSEFRIVRKDGEVRWIREHGYPEREGGDGIVTRIYGAAQDVTERRRVEAQLAAALRQRENVMETVPDVIYSTDRGGRLTDWNRRFEVVSGVERSKIAGTPAALFFVAEDRARLAEAMERALVEGDVAVEARMETPGGTRLYHYSAAPLRDEAGAVVGLTGVGRDISELKDAERRTAVLLEVARDVSGTLNEDEILDRIQRRAAGLLPCDIVATFCWDPELEAFRARSHFGVPPGLAPQVDALRFPLGVPFGGEVAGGKAVVLDDLTGIPEVAAIVPRGTLIAAPLRVRGRYLGTLVALRHGTGEPFQPTQARLCEGIASQLALTLEGAELYRRQQEETAISGALAHVGRELIAALDGPDLLGQLCKVTLDVLRCDASHTMVHRAERDVHVAVASRGYEQEAWERIRLLEMPADLVSAIRMAAGHAVRQLDVTEMAAVSRALGDSIGLQRALGESIGLQRALLMPLIRGNELIGLHVASFLQPGRRFSRADERIGEGIAQLAALALDHARAVAATNEASRLKSEFVATISHELRTPLNVIVGYDEMLLDGALGTLSAAQRDAISRADRSARELLALITDTLDLSRLEAGGGTLDCTDVALPQLIRDVVAELRESGARKGGVRLSWDVSPDLPGMHTDAGKLRLVLKNLLGNALKFTDSGFVRLSAAPVERGVEIVVQDSGIGIAPEALEYVFEAFRQADGSSTRQHEGVGLGLYIVRRIVQILGGSVDVVSEVGMGSTFRVRLPIRAMGRLAA